VSYTHTFLFIHIIYKVTRLQNTCLCSSEHIHMWEHITEHINCYTRPFTHTHTHMDTYRHTHSLHTHLLVRGIFADTNISGYAGTDWDTSCATDDRNRTETKRPREVTRPDSGHELDTPTESIDEHGKDNQDCQMSSVTRPSNLRRVRCKPATSY